MKVQKKPILRTFDLGEEFPDVSATIKQANYGDNLQRAELFAETTRIWNDKEAGPMEIKQKWNVLDQRRLEAFLTVVEISGIEDEDGNAFFRTKNGKNGPSLDMTRKEFYDSWNALPFELAEAIHDKVLEMNSDWDPDAEAEGE